MAGGVHAETLIQNRSWEYPDASGALGKEVDEPDNPQLCAVPAEYYRDGYGNVTELVKRACGGGGTPEAWMPPTPYRSTTSKYADPRLPTEIKNAKGHAETYTYDAYGRMLTQTSANGLVTTHGYDGLGRLTSVRRPDGNKTLITYYLCTSETTGASDPTSTVCLNQSATSPDGVQVKFFTMREELPVNASGVQNGPRTRYFFDALGRQISKVTEGFGGKAIHEDTMYDALGRLVHKNRPYYAGTDTPQWTKYSYDDQDRLSMEMRPDGGASIYDRSSWGAGTSVIHYETVGVGINNQVTTEFRNYRGDLVQINDAAGAITSYTYDAFSNVLSVKSPNTGKGASEQRSYLVRGAGSQYDTRGRVRWTSDISRGERFMQYNAHGDLARVLDTATATTPRAEYTYDAIGRLTQRTEADLVSKWYYDTNADGSNCGLGGATSKGWLCQATADNGFDEKYAYTVWGYPTRTTRGSLQISTNFNSDGRPSDRTYPSGFKLVFAYQPTLGYLSTLNDGGTGAALVTLGQRDAEMHALSYTLGTSAAVTVSAAYEAKTGRPYRFAATGSASLQDQTLNWDYVGNLRTLSDNKNGVTAIYDYDALNRLTKETRSGWGLAPSATPVFSWTYLPNGNIGSTTNTLGSQTYNYALTGTGPTQAIGHQVLTITGTVNGQTNPAFDYDLRGNMKTGLGRSYTWYSFDMPATVSKGTAQLAYVYGPDHQRTQEKYTVNGTLQRTTTYFTPGEMTTPLYEEEVQGTTTTKKAYIQLDGQPIAVVQHVNGVRDTKYLLKDHLGSIGAVVKADGTLGERLTYEPFGKRRYADGSTDNSGSIASTQTDRGYTGHEMLDEVGIIHMNGRLYDPWLQRFVSADPIITSPNNPQNYNRYSYVLNNPLANTDPTGFEVWGKDSSGANTQSWTNGWGSAWNSYTGERAGCVSCVASSAGPVADRNITFKDNGTAFYRPSGWAAFGMVATRGSLAIPLVGEITAFATGVTLAAAIHDARQNTLWNESMKGDGGRSDEKQSDQKSGANNAPPLPDVLVGDQRDPRAGPNKGGTKHTSGPLLPEHGGTGDFQTDLDKLTGGVRPRQPGDKAPPGSLVGANGIFGRPNNSSGGQSIDIPANGSRPHETLHYP